MKNFIKKYTLLLLCCMCVIVANAQAEQTLNRKTKRDPALRFAKDTAQLRELINMAQTMNEENEEKEEEKSDKRATAIFEFTNYTVLPPLVTPKVAESCINFEDITFTNSNVRINIDKGRATELPKMRSKAGGGFEMHIYENSVIRISTSDDSNISEIIFNGSIGKIPTADSGTFNAGTWNGNASSVTFIVTGTIKIASVIVK